MNINQISQFKNKTNNIYKFQSNAVYSKRKKQVN
jgi:hypothetical protein